jgi:hypothetical protein
MALSIVEVKAFIKQKRSERWDLYLRLKSELFNPVLNAHTLIELGREYARVEQELKEAKALLPKPWWKR